MQYSVLATSLLATSAFAAGLGKRETFSQLSGFHSNDCSGGSDVLTVVDSGAVGTCLTLGGYSSAEVGQLGGGCLVTIYTDGSCSQGAQAGNIGACKKPNSGTFNSYRVNC
ncbi:hypothetical protein F5Y14DRAFT_464089 [Nemania sp. NC0429]|nr:hypothetical protein F5Y14DRAFT_464089 [Nemania sp. NC0429]